MGPVAICNLALGWVGANRIHQLDEAQPQSTEEELCVANYDAALKLALEAKWWQFAAGRRTLEPGEESGAADYPRRFLVPADVVSVRELDDGSGAFALDWVREGDYVLTEDGLDKVYAKVTLFTEDSSKFPTAFCYALAYRLAMDLALPLTQSQALADKMEARFLRQVGRAATRDGMQGRAQRRGSSWLSRARG